MNDTEHQLSGWVRNRFLKPAFWRPTHLPPSAWLEHIPFAYWITCQHEPRVLVELGTHHGASYFAFCQAVEALALDTRCYAVDTWQGDEHAGFYDEAVYTEVNAINRSLYSGFSSLIRSTFSDAAPYFEDSSIDLLHLDGLHTEEAVRADLEMWLPKMSDRAILLLHDTNVRERNFRVASILSELRLKYPVFEFTHGHGLGVVGVGTDFGTGLRDLFTGGEQADSHRDIANFFARLGQGCALAQRVNYMEQKLSGK